MPMHGDGLQVSSEVPEPTDKAQIPGCLLDGHDAGKGHDAGQPWPTTAAGGKLAQQQQQQQQGEPFESVPLQPAAALVELDGEPCLPFKSSGLGELGLLGQAIIPPEGLVTPHLQQQLQAPAPGAYISSPHLSVSREARSGDRESPAAPLSQPSSTMIFSDLYKSPRSPLSKLRNPFPQAVPPSDFDADLVSKDKAKQKEAVRRYLAEKIRNDWEFVWPPVVPSLPVVAKERSEGDANPLSSGAPTQPQDVIEIGNPSAASVPKTENDEAPRDPGEEADSESDAESVYSTISEDPIHYRPRAEWTSDLSDDDGEVPVVPASPFRFASPEAVGEAVRTSIETKRARRRRAVREEASWNQGLACFEARRNAWTGARTVRVKPKPPSPSSPSSTRRLSFWRHHRTESSASRSASTVSCSPPGPASPLRPTATRNSQHTDMSSEPDSGKSTGAVQRTASRDSAISPVLYPVETLLPIPPPLLPPQNPMRASVTPSMYGSLYDKVVVQGLQPSCPINLSDMLRACVVGWKRDGEWPPKSSYPAPAHGSAQATAAEMLGMRQRKQQQQQNATSRKQARPPSSNTTTAPASRRLSLAGLLGGGGGNVANKAASPVERTAQQEKERDKNKENHPSRSHSHSDEGGGSSGKTLFRRSLQKVLSFGQHQHHHHQGHNNNGGAGAQGDVNTPTSPISPPAKEINTAG